MDSSISGFIDRQTVASIACVDENNEPYCFSCFYAFDALEGRMYFKSSLTSKHAQILLENRRVSGTIQPDKLRVFAIKGVQFTGTVIPFFPNEEASDNYHRRFPYALAMPGEVWVIELDAIKMTDNRIGFGKKIVWKRSDAGCELPAAG